MAFEIPGFLFSAPANTDLSSESTAQFYPVALVAATATGITGTFAIQKVAASGDPAIGILQNNPEIIQAGSVMVNGISKAYMAATCSVGDLLQANPLGFGPAASGKYAIAQALQACTAAGQIIPVMLIRNGKV